MGPWAWEMSSELGKVLQNDMSKGDGEKLTQLTSQDLLDNGGIEMRSWITLVGAVGKVPAKVLAYEPFYSGIMGMGVAYWELEGRG